MDLFIKFFNTQTFECTVKVWHYTGKTRKTWVNLIADIVGTMRSLGCDGYSIRDYVVDDSEVYYMIKGGVAV